MLALLKDQKTRLTCAGPQTLLCYLLDPAGVPAVPFDPAGASPGVLNVPAPEPGGLGSGLAKPEPEPDEEEPVVLLDEPDVDPDPPASLELEVGLAGVPLVPADPGTVSAPGVR